MESSYLLISKETVWLPDFPDIRQCQILDLICNRYSIQSPVIRHTVRDTSCPPGVQLSLNCSRGSFHICLRVIWNLYSCNYQLTDKQTLNRWKDTILTSLISENPRTKMLTKISVAASENEKITNIARKRRIWREKWSVIIIVEGGVQGSITTVFFLQGMLCPPVSGRSGLLHFLLQGCILLGAALRSVSQELHACA